LFETVMLTPPSAKPAGLTHVADVAVTPVASTGAMPKRHHSDPFSNPEPARTTAVPPTTGPRRGTTPETTGSGWYVKLNPLEVKSMLLLLTSTLTTPAA
jgi:hypothetical protein